jgi:hypothetical protein
LDFIGICADYTEWILEQPERFFWFLMLNVGGRHKLRKNRVCRFKAASVVIKSLHDFKKKFFALEKAEDELEALLEREGFEL